jgi:alpha-beta hydrolase superfamily lysophospholipase
MNRWLTRLLRLLGYGSLGVLLTLLVGYGVYVSRLPDLKPWHTATLASEYRAATADSVQSFDDYRALERRLQQELRAEVYDRIDAADRRAINRYSPGSLADPAPREPNWNLSFELPVTQPRGAALLLHGLTDSPYSLRALALHLNARGFWVVGLRLPGHGTAPSALTSVTWEDWAAAVRLAARHLERRAGTDLPRIIVGYSTGAALGVEYALSALQGEVLPRISGLVLLSPAIGVSPAAALAVWQGRAARIPGLEKLAWTDIVPEYDPYKYNSFTANAGDQVYRLTQRIRSQLAALARPGGVAGLPRVLAFQSIADATVSTSAVVDALFAKLAPERHALVVFDLNRHAEAQPLFDPGALRVAVNLFAGPPLPFDLTVLGNEGDHSAAIVARRRPANETGVEVLQTGMSWPLDVYSLAHVALPFPPDDPLYGANPPAGPPTMFLGRTQLYGERGLLVVTGNDLSRLRHNPFFDYVKACIDGFLATLPH